MSISSVTASPPVSLPAASEPKAPDVKSDETISSSSRTPEPAPRAPLPPGWGTRIDQLV